MSFLNNDALQTFYWVHLTFCPSYACVYLHIFVCMHVCMRACMRVCMRACMPRSAVGLFLFCICCWGFPGCPRQCRMFLLHRKSCSLSPFTVPQSICPPPSPLSPSFYLIHSVHINTDAFVLFHLSGEMQNKTNKHPLVTRALYSLIPEWLCVYIFMLSCMFVCLHIICVSCLMIVGFLFHPPVLSLFEYRANV